jgi:type VI secretion system secreted protein Hcp
MRRSSLIMCSTLVFLVAAFALAPAAQAAEDYFLQINNALGQAPPIKGESRDVAFRDAIELRSFSWGAKNPVTIGSATGGAGVGKASLGELTVQKGIDSATPGLFQRLVTGTHDTSMLLTVRRAGQNPFVYLQYTFCNVFVSSVNHSGDGDATQETVTFAYGAVRQRYTPQSPTGVALVPIEFGWNQVANGPWTSGGCQPLSFTG